MRQPSVEPLERMREVCRVVVADVERNLRGELLDRAALRLDRTYEPDYQEVGSAMAPVW
jgi:hypothetical protein